MIEEEGQLPQCNKCGFFMNNANSSSHQDTAVCEQYTIRRERYFKAQHQLEAKEVTFQIAGVESERVSSFRYLGRILDENDDDSHALTRQLARARARWGRMASVLRSKGVNTRAMGYFYRAVVQAILLYGSETWVLTNCQLKRLSNFHARVARYLAGRHIQQNEDGTWVQPPTTNVLEEAGLQTIDEYIKRRRDTVRRLVMFRPIYDICGRSTAITNTSWLCPGPPSGRSPGNLN